jgi:hypothetical protein
LADQRVAAILDLAQGLADTVTTWPPAARYPLGVKVRDQELAAVPLTRHKFHAGTP